MNTVQKVMILARRDRSAYSRGFRDTSGITTASASVAVTNSELVITSLSAAGGNYAVVPAASGLVVGKEYDVTVRARRGAQGTKQDIAVFTFASVSLQAVTSTTTASYTWRVTATATSGTMRIYAADNPGAIGDSVIVESISIR